MSTRRTRRSGPDDWDDPVPSSFGVGPSRRHRRRTWIARWTTVPLALGWIAAIGLGGSALPVQRSGDDPGVAPQAGRTTTVCTVAPEPGADGGGQPSGEVSSSVTAVALRLAPGREGTLDLVELDPDIPAQAPLATVTRQGFGTQLLQPSTSIVIQSAGAMAGATSGAVLTVAAAGDLAGLTAAACTAPVTSQWFVGVGADSDHRSELVLSNVDDAQAEVDLRFYGPAGLVVVPGAPGLVVPAHSSRTISLATLVDQPGPLSVWVRATGGRIAALSRDLHSASLVAAGAEWHAPSVAPATTLVVPGIPGGPGTRQLVVTNPGQQRATVNVAVLGVQGAFAPVGAEQLEVPAESSSAVSLAEGLAGQAAGVQLTSDQPVTAAVLTSTTRTNPAGAPVAADISVEPAAAPVGRTGVSAIATTGSGDADLIVSNGTDRDTQVTMEIVSLDGVTLRSDDILVPARGSSTRRIPSAGPSYLLLRTPAGSALQAAVVLSQPDGPVAGVATIALQSPDAAAPTPVVIADAAVAR